MENKRAKAVIECRKRNYDMYSVMFPKGKRDIVKEYAKSKGESMNEFILRAITETMERDSKANT